MDFAEFQGNEGARVDDIHASNSLDVQRLRQLVIKDDLTELYNRRYFKERLREEKRRGDLQGLPFSLLILDIDHFKEVNDNFGHLMGDKVLIQVARIIGESVREIDISCRYAGDEFVVILPGAGEEETEGVIRRIVDNLNAFLWEERTGIDLPKLTCSVGFCCYPDDARELSHLIKRADRALYWAKKQGRNRWVRWTHRIVTALRDQSQTTEDRTLELVGRVREREKILRMVERAGNGMGGSVLIEGEMGVGKTRLMQYVMWRMKNNGFTTLSINCFRETAEIPYFPLREALSYLEDSFDEELSAILKEIGDPHRQELYRFYPSLAGKVPVRDDADSSPLKSDAFQLFEAFLQLFVRLSHKKSLAIVVENLQWADHSTRRLLNYLARSIAHERILLIALGRTGEEISKDLDEVEEKRVEGDSTERIRLENLSKEESFLLIEGLMGGEKLPEHFLESLYSRTVGNPLFIEEMIKYLKREYHDSFGRCLGKEGFAVPGSVTEMLKRQAGTIQEDKRAILAMASVIGVEFSFDLLMLLSLKNEGYLLDVIDNAVKQRIINEVPHPKEDRYAFVNPLFQQLLYESINKRRRRNLHRQIGEYLEKYYFDRVDEVCGDLAFHFQRGGNLLKALKYTVKAGDKAEELFANREAILYFDRALEIISRTKAGESELKLRLWLRERKGDIHDLIGEYDRAERVYREVIRVHAERDISNEKKARVLGKLGVLLDKKGNPTVAIEKLKEGLELLGDGEGEGKAKLLSSLSDIYLRSGEFQKSIRCCMEGLDCLSRSRRSTVGGQINMGLGCAYLEMGDFREARFHMNQGIEIFDSIGDVKGLGRAYLSMGTLHYTTGEYDKAAEYYQKSRELASKTGNVTLLMACYNNLGMIARINSDLRHAVKHWEEGLALSEKVEHFRYIAYLKNNLGNAYRELGDFSLGRNRLQDSRKVFKELESDIDIRRTNRGLAILYLHVGDLDKAEEIIRSSGSVIEKDADGVDRLMDLDVLGRIFMKRKKYAEAEPLLKRALEGYRKAGDPEDICIGLMNLAELYISWGAPDKAIPNLDEGAELSEKIQGRKLMALSSYLRGTALLEQGVDPGRALSHLRRALRLYTRLDLPFRQMITLHALGKAYETMGQTEKAREEFQRGEEVVRRLKQRMYDFDLLHAFESQHLVTEILSKATGQ